MGQLETEAPQSIASQPAKTFTYKKTPQGDLELAVHFPPSWSAADRRPAIVFFFGGGWAAGKISQFQDQAAHLASRGMVAVRADYRVKSRHCITPKECIEDAKSAVRWLRQNAATLGINPGRIVAAGGSAGGHIAACTATIPGFEAPAEDISISSKANALVLFNAVVRLRGDAEREAKLDNDRALADLLSPISYLNKDCPPTLALVGTDDKLFPQTEEFVRRAKGLGCRAELFSAENAKHGFFNYPVWKIKTMKRTVEFLESIGYLNSSGVYRP